MPAIRKKEPQWKQRLAQIDSEVEAIRFPEVDGHALSQDCEWCDVVCGGKKRRIRLHDYDEIFRIPGLYEALFYDRLACNSPSRMARLLEEVIRDFGQTPQDLTVLDVGAGNGMVGDELNERETETVVGVDILPEAREATQRDRPGVYEEYLVTDLTDLPEPHEKTLRKYGFNCLTTVAALGFGDIPPMAFVKALDLIETDGWVAFTIKECFLHEEDRSGFSRLVRHLSRQRIIQIQAYRRFRHRMSIRGKPLYYVAMVARKLKDMPDRLVEADAETLEEVCRPCAALPGDRCGQ